MHQTTRVRSLAPAHRRCRPAESPPQIVSAGRDNAHPRASRPARCPRWRRTSQSPRGLRQPVSTAATTSTKALDRRAVKNPMKSRLIQTPQRRPGNGRDNSIWKTRPRRIGGFTSKPPAMADPKDRSATGKVAVGVGWIVAWRMATRNLGLISTLLLVRLLRPEDFGLVARVDGSRVRSVGGHGGCSLDPNTNLNPSVCHLLGFLLILGSGLLRTMMQQRPHP